MCLKIQNCKNAPVRLVLGQEQDFDFLEEITGVS